MRTQALATGEDLSLDSAVTTQGQVTTAGRELRDAHIVVAGVADAVAIRVALGWVRDSRAVVGDVGHTVAVAIGITGIPYTVSVRVCLGRIRDGRAVIGSVWYAVAVQVWIADIANAVAVLVLLTRVGVVRTVVD